MKYNRYLPIVSQSPHLDTIGFCRADVSSVKSKLMSHQNWGLGGRFLRASSQHLDDACGHKVEC